MIVTASEIGWFAKATLAVGEAIAVPTAVVTTWAIACPNGYPESGHMIIDHSYGSVDVNFGDFSPIKQILKLDWRKVQMEKV